jgi:murein DD-endopeptidase MepM/ murein hydrolase activator NlpD
VVPDLPYVRSDVPENSGGPTEGRLRTPSLLSVARVVRAAVAVTVCTAVSLALGGQLATADDLTDRRKDLQAQLAQTRSNLSESSAVLRRAALAVDRTSAALGTAQAALAQTRRQLAAASQRDRLMATKLRTAQTTLAKARAAVLVGEQKLATQDALTSEIARNQYQQQTNLLPIAMLLESRSIGDLQTRLQWSSTLFETAAHEMDRLTALKRQLEAARARADSLERQVAADRKVAAANLVTTRGLEQRAAIQTASVSRLLTQQRALRAAAADDVDTDKRRYAELEAERNSVERRIAERIAAAKAAAARRAAVAARRAAAEARQAAADRAAAAQARAAAKRAAQRATVKAAEARRARARAARIRAERARDAAAREARAERAKAQRAESRAKQSASKSSSSRRSAAASRKKKSSSSGSSRNRSASHGFSYPVNGSISSPYGMRFHPILRYWKLHDGTDFGASCGTPLRAPYSGRVAERYFNSGYGNRLMIDHGDVDGRFVTTGYNHASRYTVRVGERVSKGEVIGYVGSTGYSTGCHLHLMVWLDGNRTNPMSWF